MSFPTLTISTHPSQITGSGTSSLRGAAASRKTSTLIAGLVCCVAACSTADQSPTSALNTKPPTDHHLSLSQVAGRSTPEAALLVRIRQSLSQQDGDSIVALVSNPRAHNFSSNSPALQEMFDQLSTLRRRQVDSLVALAAAKAGRISRVTVILSDSPLRDSTASAEVIHRSARSPHDLIVLPPRGGTPRTWGGALTALSRILAIQDTAATPADLHIVMHNGAMPRRWAGTALAGHAQAELDSLRRAGRSAVPGFGIVRTRELLIGR